MRPRCVTPSFLPVTNTTLSCVRSSAPGPSSAQRTDAVRGPVGITMRSIRPALPTLSSAFCTSSLTRCASGRPRCCSEKPSVETASHSPSEMTVDVAAHPGSSGGKPSSRSTSAAP